jgi:hypothetical protein
MEFDYRYSGSSSVRGDASGTEMSFAPDTLREPTYFVGKLGKGIAFREAISALHDVVVSDLRFKPKPREEYKEWAREQLDMEVAREMARSEEVASKISELGAELRELRARHTSRRSGFWKQQQKYFDYLYRHDYQAWFVLDPVITVHPDELFFECFSEDESSYGRLGVDYEVFEEVSDFACGTTNIDYSEQLYGEFQKIRSYKTTRFAVDPGGFDVQTTGEDSYREVKIDLPDSWVRGFLQVNSAMALPTVSFELHPMDVHNFCFMLRRNRERKGPRSIRYVLEPDRPIRAIFEPWDREIVCPRSIYRGDSAEEIRVWGRRRLHMLERLIPIARSFTVHLLGTGMPSFYIADLGRMSFTLGLSGWTSNDWSKSGNFDLMAPRADVPNSTKKRIFDELRTNWYERPERLAERLNLGRDVVLGALAAYAQNGRAIYDLNKGVYRVRELTREPLPMERLRFSNEREERATRFVNAGNVTVSNRRVDPEGNLHLSGEVVDGSRTQTPSMTIDPDQRMTEAQCSCYFYSQNKLYKGPCEHMLALRMKFKWERH